MKLDATVVLISHDAGGARTLIPVAKSLHKQGVRIQAFVAGPSASIWKSECPEIPSQPVADTLTQAQATTLLVSAQMLVSACGLYNQMEHTFRLAARDLGLYSVSVLDSWFFYKERFERTKSGKPSVCFPDVVCVMDDLSYQGMISAGLEPSRICVTGGPNLETTVDYCRSITPAQVATWRQEQGIEKDDFVVTFFSEPFITGPQGKFYSGPGALVDGQGQSLLGYTSIDILKCLFSELDAAFQKGDRKCRLVIKTHPSEDPSHFRSMLESHRRPWLHASMESGRAADWIARSNLLIGSLSIALLEGALAGKPALSVQIGLQEAGATDFSIGNLTGYTIPIFTREELKNTLTNAFQNRLTLAPRSRPLIVSGAAERVARVILMGSSQRVAPQRVS